MKRTVNPLRSCLLFRLSSYQAQDLGSVIFPPRYSCFFPTVMSFLKPVVSSPGQGPWLPMCQLSDAHSRALSLTITFGHCCNMKSSPEYRMPHWTNATFRTCENPHAAVCVIEQSWHSAIPAQIKHPWWFSLWFKFHHNILSYIPILWTLLLFSFIEDPFWNTFLI